MRKDLLQILQKITPEEERLRSGKKDIERELYCSDVEMSEDMNCSEMEN